MAFDPFVSSERALQMQVRLGSIEDLFQDADFITLHLPRTPETENLVDLKLLSTMKKNARLVNCARGGIINESDLAEALNSGVITGAALDVYAQEPLNANSPLLNVEKGTCISPSVLKLPPPSATYLCMPTILK